MDKTNKSIGPTPKPAPPLKDSSSAPVNNNSGTENNSINGNPQQRSSAPPWKLGKYSASRYAIKPPVKVESKYASPIKRLAASIIDSLIIGFVGNLVANSIGKISDLLLSDYSLFSTGNSSIVGNIPTYVLGPLYYVFFTGSSGQTLGKLILGIKVVSKESGKTISYLSAVLRETVGKFVSTLVLGLGFAWMLWDKEKQCWHDKIAGTVVVNVTKNN